VCSSDLALVVYFGVYPKPILEPVDNSVKQLVQTMYVKSITPTAKETLARVNSIGEAQ
jgi:NADH-quinone oxidoreductase subunit M